MRQSEELGELATALVAFQGAMAPVKKEAENTFFKSKYADLAAVVKEAMPIHTEHGLAVTQWPSAGGLTTRLLHTSGQWMEEEAPLYLPKQDPQGQGSAITYMRRYAYCAILGIVADEDDDGNAASQGQERQPRAGGVKPVSEKQLDLIEKLAKERGVQPPTVKDSAEASKAIDDLYAIPKAQS